MTFSSMRPAALLHVLYVNTQTSATCSAQPWERRILQLVPSSLIILHLGRKAQGRGSMYWYLPLLELCSDVLQLHEYCNEAHWLHFSSALCWLEDADVRKLYQLLFFSLHLRPAQCHVGPTCKPRPAPPTHPLEHASRWCRTCDFIYTHKGNGATVMNNRGC